jgi:hypothetical protein
MYTITLEAGDWSDDGHGKTANYIVESSLDAKKLQKAYDKGSKIVGFDLSEDVCSDYEDSAIPQEYLDAISSRAPFSKKLRDQLKEDGEYSKNADPHIWHDSFAELWMLVAKIGCPELDWKFVENNTANIHIGGYGLFN